MQSARSGEFKRYRQFVRPLALEHYGFVVVSAQSLHCSLSGYLTRISNGVPDMNLELWIPALILIGLVTMSLIFAFVVACEKV
jgi:hypothetical protein